VRLLYDMLKAHKGLANYSEILTAVTEVQSRLMSAQAAALTSQEREATLAQRIRELEKEVAELKDWRREAERYRLINLTWRIPVYSLKPGMENGEPAHYLCANCFARSQKSFLQRGPGLLTMSCAQCNSVFHGISPRTTEAGGGSAQKTNKK
jgi:hypothetical protein